MYNVHVKKKVKIKADELIIKDEMKSYFTKFDDFLYQAEQDIEYGEAILGYLRYEELRKLNVSQFAELFKRNIAGENFDKMVDELIYKNNVES